MSNVDFAFATQQNSRPLAADGCTPFRNNRSPRAVMASAPALETAVNDTSLRPLIVGIGGAARPLSSSETALRLALQSAEQYGARTELFGGAELRALPHYLSPEDVGDIGRRLLTAIRAADGVIIASPAYHGSISGLVKNAIDYIEVTARDSRAYLDGLPVGLIVCAYGWQATGSTLTALRSIVHALRGWPTPFGAGLNTSSGIFQDGVCTDLKAAAQLELVGRQVAEFAATQRAKAKTTLHVGVGA
jgi:FMN reductase